MKVLIKPFVLAAWLLAAAIAPQWALAQVRPVAVISISSVDEVLGDIAYLTEAAGMADVGKTAALFAGPYTIGLDKTRPIAALVTLDGGEPSAVVFVPIKDLNTQLAVLREVLGEPEDAGDGVLRLSGGPQPVYIKQQGDWALVGQKSADVTGMAGVNPINELDGLHTDYDLAVRFYMQNVPQELRDVLVSEMKAGFERGIADQLDNDPDQRELTEKLGRNFLDTFVSFVEDTQSVTLGWRIDAVARNTHVDFALRALPDTNLAAQLSTLQDSPSSFAGFKFSDAAATMNFAGPISARDKEQTNLMLTAVRDRAIEELDKDANVRSKEDAKAILGNVFDTLIATIDSGKLDGGGALILKPDNISIAAGFYVADSGRLEASVKRLVEVVQRDEPDAQLQARAEQHGAATLHVLTMPLPPNADVDARKLLGDNVTIVVGAGPQAAYFGLGKECVALVKQGIDNSAAGGPKVIAPSELAIAIGPILKFAAPFDDSGVAELLAGAADQFAGRDHITMRVMPAANGAVYRLQIDDGVLQLIGSAAKMFGGPGGAPPF